MTQTYTVVDVDAALVTTLAALRESGAVVSGGASSSVGSGKEARELLNFTAVIQNPRERLVRNPKRPLNLPAAVARFVWMMAGSDRLADIAFYEEKVRYFSDDGVSVPGSSYGQRMLQARPGLNQLASVIRRLKVDPSSRRATIAIYHPEDATRESRDIPCTFGLAYHVRGESLLATTLMRSNNAFTLLPYNVFEFSLLAEVVAQELGVSLGPLTHTALSMHLYAADYERADAVIGCADRNALAPIPVMPVSPSPLEEVRKLVVLEAELRHRSAAIGRGNIEEWIEKGERTLSPYWRQYFYLLLVHVAVRNGEARAFDSLLSIIEAPWSGLLPARPSEANLPEVDFSLELPPDHVATVVPLVHTRMHRSLRDNAERWEKGKGRSLPWRVFVKLEERFAGQVAARGDAGLIEEEEFDRATAEALSEGHG
jgi:thymidylate synthase